MSQAEVFKPANGQPLFIRDNISHGNPEKGLYPNKSCSRPSTQSNSRFGQLSLASFFTRHNPHPTRVRHIKGKYISLTPGDVTLVPTNLSFNIFLLNPWDKKIQRGPNVTSLVARNISVWFADVTRIWRMSSKCYAQNSRTMCIMPAAYQRDVTFGPISRPTWDKKYR
jgi:hypothetical protein